MWLACALICSLFGVCLSEITCEHPNDCQTSPESPYCVSGFCRQCNPTITNTHERRCMCSLGEYCVANPSDPFYGTCIELESSIIGRNCDKTLEGKGLELVKGANETVFCGNVVFNENNTATIVEWEGVCTQSTCSMCRSSLAPTLPNALCVDGRSCYRGSETIAYVGIYSWVYTTESPLFLLYYVGLLITIITTPIILILTLTTAYYAFHIKRFENLEGTKIELWYDFFIDLVTF